MRFKELIKSDGARTWGAISGEWQFVIVMLVDIGYTASVKNRKRLHLAAKELIDYDFPVKHWWEAEAACKFALRELKKQH